MYKEQVLYRVGTKHQWFSYEKRFTLFKIIFMYDTA